MSDVLLEIEKHRIWLETIGGKGTKLFLDEEDLSGIDLPICSFGQSSIIDCKLDKLSLKEFDFHSALLCSTSFKGTNLFNCDFYKSDLRYCDFTESVIEKSFFSKADLDEAIFNRAEIINSNFVNTSCYLTDFRNAFMKSVDISNSVFEETLFRDARLKNIFGIDEAHFISINIGSVEKPIILEGDDAKNWVIDRCIS